MSQIAALLLMYLIDEEDAFWALSQLMVDNRYAMHGKQSCLKMKNCEFFFFMPVT